MLDDRDYMRQPEYHAPRWRPRFHFQWSWTLVFLATYAVVFLSGLFVGKFFPKQNYIFDNLALSLDGLEHGYVWQLVTYQFMHAGWFHIFMNSWVIYMFGREIETMLGGKRFLTLMFCSGIIGGIFQMIVALLWPQYFGGAVVGASACGFGLVAAYALIFPERELTMLILFVIPIQMRAKTLLIGSAVLALTGFAFPNVIMPGVAHAAHLGGMAMGWLYVRKILRRDVLALEGGWHPPENVSMPYAAAEPPEEKSAAGFVESEVDPILDKISAHGLQSLTARERETLEKARKKIA